MTMCRRSAGGRRTQQWVRGPSPSILNARWAPSRPICCGQWPANGAGMAALVRLRLHRLFALKRHSKAPRPDVSLPIGCSDI